ncbi:MAG: DUF4468 domain-containing protein [Sphingobacteriales bacterium JAD_PAG50586_3]|nr:MAG: DUF4468 domain-containing protein [Sphingobacteriales bacterium JAD_PAG50586_3]
MVVDSTTQSQLFDRAATYLTTYFSTTKSFIYKIDKSIGQIVIKPCINFPFKRDRTEYNGGLWHYTGTFTIKHGKYFYRLDNFYNTDFMFGTPGRMDLGPIECLYENNNCNTYMLSNNRPDAIQCRMILKNIHKTMVAFMQDFDTAMRTK